MPPTLYTSAGFEDLVSALEAQLLQDAMRAFDVARLQTALADIQRAVEAGDPELAGRMARIVSSGISDATRTAFETAARETAANLSRALGVTVSFDGLNAGAIAAMRANQLRLIRQITADQRAVLGRILTQGVTAGINPREVARQIRASIGLTDRQWLAVDRYRANLETLSSDALARQLRDRRFDPTVRRAIASDTPLGEAQIDAMVDRYAQRWVNYRAETIARTEGLRAAHEGAYEMIRQAVDEGVLRPDDLVQRWNTAGDARVRESHEEMHGQEQAVGEPFITGDGFPIRYPGDPEAPAEETINCRCVVSTRFRTAR